MPVTYFLLACCAFFPLLGICDQSETKSTAQPRLLLWGDTHVHTSNSFDAFARGARLSVDDAYRFARGDEIRSNTGQLVKLERALDFIVVADHGEAIGQMQAIAKDNKVLTSNATIARWRDMILGDQAYEASAEIIAAGAAGKLPPPMTDPAIAGPLTRSIWTDYLKSADRYNDPGRFTTLIGYEWSSTPDGDNLHRVVVFRDDQTRVGKILPFSFLNSPDPEDLWAFLDEYEQNTGGQALAIPHNSNLSNGRMFATVTYDGDLIDSDYAKRRARWEPLVEATQIKGDSESHPYLSPDDDFAAFGDQGWQEGGLNLLRRKARWMYRFEYLRSALQTGLALQAQLGANPYTFGMIGSSDSHTGLAAVEESNYFGKFGVDEPKANRSTRVTHENGAVKIKVAHQQAAGYAAVWARENSREAIFDALRRKEVYASTGPRITLRFFGGWNFESRDAKKSDFAAVGYRKGVPMGSELGVRDKKTTPSFLIGAARDPDGANLDRVQVIKGWIDANGDTHEKIFDVAWSDRKRRRIDSEGKLAPVGNTVRVTDASYTNTIGAGQLQTVWRDPEFDPAVAAFYYLRVLEIPTPRWTSYDAARFNTALPEKLPATHQERAYSSPIWYSPD